MSGDALHSHYKEHGWAVTGAVISERLLTAVRAVAGEGYSLWRALTASGKSRADKDGKCSNTGFAPIFDAHVMTAMGLSVNAGKGCRFMSVFDRLCKVGGRVDLAALDADVKRAVRVTGIFVDSHCLVKAAVIGSRDDEGKPGPIQPAHHDFGLKSINSALNRRDANPSEPGTYMGASVFTPLEREGCTLRIWDKSHKLSQALAKMLHSADRAVREAARRMLDSAAGLRYIDVYVPFGHLLIFSGSLVHCGLGLDHVAFRAHWYVSTEPIDVQKTLDMDTHPVSLHWTNDVPKYDFTDLIVNEPSARAQSAADAYVRRVQAATAARATRRARAALPAADAPSVWARLYAFCCRRGKGSE